MATTDAASAASHGTAVGGATRKKSIAALILAVAMVAVSVSSAYAAKGGDFFIGVAGPAPTGTAADNHRVQKFGFADNGTPADTSDDLPLFAAAFGSDVVPDGGSGDRPGPN